MKPSDYSIIGTRIRELRESNDLSQAQLGNIIAFSQDTISLWENSKSLPPVYVIIELAKHFEVTSDYLLGLSDY